MKQRDFESVALRFPKVRPRLPDSYQRIYSEEYAFNRGSCGGLGRIVRWLEEWMHRWVARQGSGFPVLELGAGTLNHIRFEDEQGEYDIVEPFTLLHSEKTMELQRIRDSFADISEITDTRRYRRIISIAVLEHLTDLPLVLAQAVLLLDSDGAFLAGVPSEGGMTWGGAWRCTTGLSFRLRRGLPYQRLMRHEHINDVTEIETVIRYFYRDVMRFRFPLPWLHGSFYTCFRATKPDLARAVAFVESRKMVVA